LPDIKWSAVEAFHLDEYVGLPVDHPASFRLWVKTRFADLVHPGLMHYLSADELERYSKLLAEAPLDLCFVGIGENGHIGFNDPHVADFHDPALVKRVTLDETCRRQQVGEGHFPNLSAVPLKAVTFTCPAVVSARALVCSVPDLRKAEAVRNAIEGELSTTCPASLLRTHPNAFLYLDSESASLLSKNY
jgi:glucosamine-6-phosphate deaminase